MIKEQLGREKAAEVARLSKAASRVSKTGPGRGGRPAAFMKASANKKALDGKLKVGFSSHSRLLAGIGGDDKKSVAGPSKVTFKGPKNDETSKKQRACELHLRTRAVSR